MPIVFFLARIVLVIALFRLIYIFYKKLSPKSPKEKLSKKSLMSACPSPKTFIDYTEGRIKGKQKQNIAKHISGCKNCQDALKNVFDIPAKKESSK